MGLLSFLKSAAVTPSAKPVADAADDVQVLRLRARRRLIGAAVLVALGVIGFPLVFETQPRPIPVDLPIDIPRKETAVPLAIPAPVAVAQTPVVEATPDPVVETATVAPTPAPVAVPTVLPAPAQVSVEKPKEKSPPTPPQQNAAARADAARVQALLDGRPADAKASDPAAPGRFIVQVGAYADAKAAQDVRMKVEKLGLKTYTQAVDTADGRRIRVRVGPFATREEAGKVAAKVASGGGLKTVVLTL